MTIEEAKRYFSEERRRQILYTSMLGLLVAKGIIGNDELETVFLIECERQKEQDDADPGYQLLKKLVGNPD